MLLGVTGKEKRGEYVTITTEDTHDLVKVYLNKRATTPASTKYSIVSDWSKNV